MPSLFGEFDGTSYDISALRALVIDLRGLAGGTKPDASAVVPAGTFSRSVHGVADADTGLYVGEVICTLNGMEIRIVGARTGRPGLIELTPLEIYGAWRQGTYANQLRDWLKLPPTARH